MREAADTMGSGTMRTGGAREPRILAFVCRWCTYAGADLAGTSRLKYPAQIRIVKLPCSGRIDPLFLLRGLEMGADGILVSGCHPGDCHYMTGNYYARRRWVLFRALLDFVGFDMRRVHFSWVSAAEGTKFVDVVKAVTASVREAGPFPGFAPRADRRSEGIGPSRGGGQGGGDLGDGSGDRDRTGDGRKIVTTLIDALRDDLASGVVRAILGYVEGRRSGVLRPAWASDPGEVGRLRFAAGAHPSLVTYLARRLREEPEGTFGILAGPQEEAAIRLLKGESQIDPARVRIYAQQIVAAEGTRMDSWEIYGVPAPDRPAEERWDYWTAQFARCMRCNACRQGCPLCVCNRCVADKTRPRWIDPSPNAAGNWIWNVTRALHRAGHCVDCGSCTEACPAGIPLGALNRYLLSVAERTFGPPPEGEGVDRSPLVSYRLEDEAPFIR